jgi:hypothetical protein
MRRPGERYNRAQVSPVAMVLVIVLVLAGSTAVVVFGATAIGQSQDSLSEQRAEKAMTQFDSKAALVALGNSDTQQVDFGTDRQSSYEVNEGEGWMRIIVENQTNGDTTEVVNESLGTMTYEVDDRTIAYQSGGVWKRIEDNESVMVSPPEFYFRDGTLTLPIVNITGAASVGSKASITHEETVEKYPDTAAGNENPLRNHLVKVSVRSQYYKGWGRYFEERTDGDVEYDHDRNVVNLTLVSPVGLRKITAATSSLSASGSFEIHGSADSACSGDDDQEQAGNKEMYTNSYNSSKSGDYCDQASAGDYGHQGDIIYGEDVNISFGSGGSWIHGNVESGGNVTVSASAGSGQTSVYGNINHTDSCNPSTSDCEDRVENTSASVNEIDGIPTEPQIDYYVDNRIEKINDSGNPGGAPIDSNDRLQFSSNEVELTDGKYILDKIDFTANGGGDEIVLNTTDGDITVAVREDVSIPADSNITIEGDGNVLLFVGNESSSQWAFEMAKGSAVWNDGDNADQFRLYGKEDVSVRIGDNSADKAKFVGVIYTPPGNDGNGTVELNKGEVFGGIVTGTTVIENGGSIHYDEALREKQVINPDANVLKVTYLHVSVNRVRVD